MAQRCGPPNQQCLLYPPIFKDDVARNGILAGDLGASSPENNAPTQL
jgi:hypothetical protein